MMRTWHRQIAAVALLLAGIGLRCTAVHSKPDGGWLFLGLGVILAVSAVWPLSNRIARACDRVDARLKRWPLAVAAGVAGAVATHLFLKARRFRTDLYLKFQDEFVYVIQAHMLARGRLWLPPYPASVRDFFDSFYLIVDRVYAGMYPPGTAIMLLPGIWLGWAHWIMPILAGTAAAALLYLVLEEMFGAVRAIVGVLLLGSLTLFMSMSLMALSEGPLLVAELACWWAWMRWRRTRAAGWLWLMGAAAGYGAITRPADMFCAALAIGTAIAFQMRTEPAKLLKAAGAIGIAASPFLAIQLAQNFGVTGRWDQTPLRYYTDRNYPAPILSFRDVSAADVPPTNLPIKRTLIKQWILPAYEQHWRMSLWEIWYPGRLDEIIGQTMPDALLVILIPLAALSLGEIRRAAIVGAMLLFFVIYTADPVFLRHYALAIVPAVICLILMGWESLERAFPRARGAILTFMLLAIGLLAVRAMPECNPVAAPMGTGSDDARIADRILAALPRRPALVLFQFDPKSDSYHAAPVYNADVAWPDDAPIVRANDLGENENVRIYRYYARRGQNRDVYLYDRTAARNGHSPLTRLGTTGQLSHE
ncbi:MAG: glycosyltransferase family 39 protein [Tepidisphaeraceae bacterium]|jgi:hypothetical protein